MFSDPVKNVSQSGIAPGAEVADFGAGSGFYTLAIARHLAGTGHVYGIDVQKDILTKLKNTAIHDGLYNVEVIWGDVEKRGGTKLRDATMDAVFITNLLFQLEDKEGCIEEAKRVLVSGGTLILIDWQESFGGFGPAKGAVVTKEVAIELLTKKGFSVAREIAAGSHHYGILCTKL